MHEHKFTVTNNLVKRKDTLFRRQNVGMGIRVDTNFAIQNFAPRIYFVFREIKMEIVSKIS
jgi:hypothetical protein